MNFACQHCDALATHQVHVAGTARFLLLCQDCVDRLVDDAEDEAVVVQRLPELEPSRERHG